MFDFGAVEAQEEADLVFPFLLVLLVLLRDLNIFLKCLLPMFTFFGFSKTRRCMMIEVVSVTNTFCRRQRKM